MPFRLVTIESRALTFKFLESLNETCVSECHMFIPPQFANQEPKCTDRNISNSMLLVTDLKADQRYNLHFYNCKTRIFYGELDVKTEQDRKITRLMFLLFHVVLIALFYLSSWHHQ